MRQSMCRKHGVLGVADCPALISWKRRIYRGFQRWGVCNAINRSPNSSFVLVDGFCVQLAVYHAKRSISTRHQFVGCPSSEAGRVTVFCSDEWRSAYNYQVAQLRRHCFVHATIVVVLNALLSLFLKWASTFAQKLQIQTSFLAHNIYGDVSTKPSMVATQSALKSLGLSGCGLFETDCTEFDLHFVGPGWCIRVIEH